MRQLPQRTTVLVVEDDSQLREFYRSSLTAAGFAAVGVEDGIDALRVIERHVPAALVLDIGLPRLNGLDLHRELLAHRQTRDLPIVVVTGTETAVNEQDFGCVLRKPVGREALIFAVEQCLRKARAKRP